MSTNLTSKGQVTIPKRIRDALNLAPGSAIEFFVGRDGDIVLRRANGPQKKAHGKDRFESARGTADIKWRTNDLMQLLRGDS
jgi:antitoxin PrlF